MENDLEIKLASLGRGISVSDMESWAKYVLVNLKQAYDKAGFPNRYENYDDFSVTFAKIDGEFKWLCKVFGVNIVGYGEAPGVAVVDFLSKFRAAYK